MQPLTGRTGLFRLSFHLIISDSMLPMPSLTMNSVLQPSIYVHPVSGAGLLNLTHYVSNHRKPFQPWVIVCNATTSQWNNGYLE